MARLGGLHGGRRFDRAAPLLSNRLPGHPASHLFEHVRDESLKNRLADLRDERECARLVDEAGRTWGGVEVWVNNAGADTLTGEAARFRDLTGLRLESWSV